MRARSLAEELERRLPGRVYTDPAVASLYAREPSGLEGRPPAAVVLAREPGDVSLTLRLAYKFEVPVYLQGSLSSLSGSAVPLDEGIVISFEKMSRVREFSPVDGYVEAEAGVRLGELNSLLAREGYMFPVDPASVAVATVGGAVNSGAGGLRGAKYGTMRDWVLGLEAVLPDKRGSVIRVGCRVVKCRQGYDLTRLIVGSEGTLAAVTAAVLRLARLPRRVVVAAAFFPELEGLAAAVAEVKAAGYEPLIMEFMDAPTVAKAVEYVRPGFEAAGHMLLVAVEAADCEAVEVLERLSRLLSSHGASRVYTAPSMREAEPLIKLRRAMYPSQVRLALEEKGPGTLVYVEDIAVPPSRLVEAVRGVRSLAESYGFEVLLGGHVGDGNLHPIVAFDPRNPGEAGRAEQLFREIMRLAVKLGGTVSAEHGIGVLKREGLRMELEALGSLRALELMKQLKRVFDPKGILNPHKVVW
ncbi:MAG: FAD-binding protein [Crenarchaeota archaeon]|nr:FAD-binding protein [Thermoproteota archaeon]